VTTIDLNADLGEGCAFDLELLGIVSSCNIACGGHAGDAASMLTTVRQALANGVAIGAHPAYPDRAGFGRSSVSLAGGELKESLIKQLDAFAKIAASEGAAVAHVKPHGTLYRDAARDRSVAQLVADAVQQVTPNSALVGPAESALQDAANNAGLSFVAEAFVDRTYLPDRTLLSRSEPGAVHTDINTMTAQAVSLAMSGQVTAQDGTVIAVVADTLCIHGDTSNAAEAARAVRDVLQANGVDIRAVD